MQANERAARRLGDFATSSHALTGIKLPLFALTVPALMARQSATRNASQSESRSRRRQVRHLAQTSSVAVARTLVPAWLCPKCSQYFLNRKNGPSNHLKRCTTKPQTASQAVPAAASTSHIHAPEPSTQDHNEPVSDTESSESESSDSDVEMEDEEMSDRSSEIEIPLSVVHARRNPRVPRTRPVLQGACFFL